MTPHEIIIENSIRLKALNHPFNPVDGDASSPTRFLLDVKGMRKVYLPVSMKNLPLVKDLIRFRSLHKFFQGSEFANSLHSHSGLFKEFDRLREVYDFPFWTSRFILKNAEESFGSKSFRLRPADVKLTREVEKMIVDSTPVRLIILKPSNSGISDCICLLMTWMQLVRHRGVGSMVVSPDKDSSEYLMRKYLGFLSSATAKKEMESGKVFQRIGSHFPAFKFIPGEFNVKFVTSRQSDACRGGSFSLLYLNNLEAWKNSSRVSPSHIIEAAYPSVPLSASSMIILDSHPVSSGSFFFREYRAAVNNESQFKNLFIPWFDFPSNTLPFIPGERERFAKRLLTSADKNSFTASSSISGKYLWSLWNKGATLEGLNWYLNMSSQLKRKDVVFRNFPSSENEAFLFRGNRLMNPSQTSKLSKGCVLPSSQGFLTRDNEGLYNGSTGKLIFMDSKDGTLTIWKHPDNNPYFECDNRYVAVLSFRSEQKSSFTAFLAVFDRIPSDNNLPETVAQWKDYGMVDTLVPRAVEVAEYYHDALLVIENISDDFIRKSLGIDDYRTNYIFSGLQSSYRNIVEINNPSLTEDLRVYPLNYGFIVDRVSGPKIISFLRRAVVDCQYVERDIECIKKYSDPQDMTLPVKARDFESPLVMTRAIALYVIHEKILPSTCRRDRFLDMNGNFSRFSPW